MSMRFFPLTTLPQRARNRFNETLYWPLKTILEYNVLFVRARLAQKKHITIITYPERPKYFHALYKISKYLGWHITTNINARADIAIFFEDITVRAEYPELAALAKRIPVLNMRCTDIRKTHVDEVFFKVFGYRMSLNPKTHNGVCVKKSDVNAVHDGVVVTCPVKPEPGYVYQKLIDTACGNGRVMDIRVPVCMSSIPFVMKRYKSSEDIFDITVDASMASTNEVLSTEEQMLIVRFCNEIGLEYGELDALRDNKDGRLYIVDVNNTPAGPIGPMYSSKQMLHQWREKNGVMFNTCIRNALRAHARNT